VACEGTWIWVETLALGRAVERSDICFPGAHSVGTAAQTSTDSSGSEEGCNKFKKAALTWVMKTHSVARNTKVQDNL
jgi:hypothetical protein